MLILFNMYLLLRINVFSYLINLLERVFIIISLIVKYIFSGNTKTLLFINILLITDAELTPS